MTTPPPAPDTALDRLTERIARHLAARTTRRGFLGRLARVLVAVAAGPTLVALLADRAEARVCGQSGITPKCPTFDCDGPDDVWGWCWYASPGCCANGGLKKICDCCTRDWPNVHGYCPSGTNVRCIMESCHADPRVLGVPLGRIAADDGIGAALEAAARSLATTAWLVDDDPLRAAVVAPLAAADALPVLLTGPDRLDPRVIRHVQRHGIARLSVPVGGLGAGALAEARRYVAVEEVGTAAELGPWSAAVAALVAERTGTRRILAVDGVGASAALAPATGALAALLGFGLVVGRGGLDAVHAGARRPVVTWLVGPEAAAWRGGYPGAVTATAAATLTGATRELARAVLAVEPATDAHLTVVPATATDLHRGAGLRPGILLAHPDGRIDGETSAAVRDLQPVLASATRAGTVGGPGSEGVWELQSALNRFDTHQLVGVAGQGLPVRSQPYAEREIGRARVAGAARGGPDESSYWLGRANPARHP